MIEVEAQGRSIMLMALAAAARTMTLRVADRVAEGEPEGISQPCAEWTVSADKIVGNETEFTLPNPVGMVVGYDVRDADGLVLFSERFRKPYDFREFGGRLGIAPSLALSQAGE